jgi:hypothetical protein
MAADTFWRVPQEQAGETMTLDDFRHWRERKAYTPDEPARSDFRRMVAYYEKGDRSPDEIGSWGSLSRSSLSS